MKRLIFVCLLMTCSASWAEWKFTGSTKSGSYTAYHEKSTIRKNGSIVKMWIMWDFSVIQTDTLGDKYLSQKVLVAYDCRSETSAAISIVQFSDSMGNGVVVYTGSRKENALDWTPVVPNSIDEAEWQIACGKK